MCGIVGMIHPEEKDFVDPGILRLMNSSLRHRGPDDEGYWVDRHVGLAMKRLSIIDLEGGHQPIANETQDVWTVFNGEIYNFLELRQELIRKGHTFQSRTDTEVIVHLYEEEGENFIHRLRGMFAIALWDSRRKRLLLYRDRIGIKPLHYWCRKGVLIFGSEIKAILQYPEVERELSLEALSDYLSFLYIPTPKTIYRGIHKLPAGCMLQYQEGQIEIKSYWDFPYSIRQDISAKEWEEQLRAALKESVKLHLVGDVPVGAFLSGGMDSSTVVAWMSQANGDPVKTYSMGFSDDRFNELPFARKVAGHFGTEHHEQMVEPDAFELLPKILSGFDEPFADSSAIPTYLVSEFARREVKVALSGDGGDELFGGYLWTRKELWLEKYRRLPAPVRQMAARFFLKKDYRPLRETTFFSTLQRFIYDAGQNPSASFARRVTNFPSWMKKDLLQPWVWEEMGGDSGSDLVNSLWKEKPARSVMDKLLYWDSKFYLPDDLLTKVDRMSMLHSLEVRVPFLDHRVVELACSIPFSLKVKAGTTKYILKEAMKGFLPPRILKQRKQGFAIPLRRWFFHELSDFARKLLLDSSGWSRHFFRTSYVRWLLEEHRSGRQNFGTQIYALVIFELWNRLAKETKGKIASQAFALKDLAE